MNKGHKSKTSLLGEGGVLPSLAWAGMCRWTGYANRGLESQTGYIISPFSVFNSLSGMESLKEGEGWPSGWSTCVLPCVLPTILFQKKPNFMFSVQKRYLILHENWNESGSFNEVSCLKGTQSAMGPRWPGHYFCQFENRSSQPEIKCTRQIHLEIRFNLA